MPYDNRPVGMFDSGVGGTSVLACAMELLPQELFVFFADQKHVPYGEKPVEDVRRYIADAVRVLLAHDIKALVVACNTATAVAIEALRKLLTIPVIGVEPALRPASKLGAAAPVLVMATPMTLTLQKYRELVHQLGDPAHVIPMPCPGLADMIEKNAEGEEIMAYLRQHMPDGEREYGAVVLGCTHYLFVKPEVQTVFPGAAIVNGNVGTVHQLKRLVAPAQHFCEEGRPRVEILSSGTEADVTHTKAFLKRALDEKVWE